jgi:hypothetical protein
MELKNILAISGKPGLYRLISSTASRLVVESIADGKKMPVPSTSKVSSLEDIAIFTTEEEVPLAEVLQRLYEHTGKAEGPSHKAPATELRTALSEILDDVDHERVYDSDLKKLFNWFNILFNAGYFVPSEEPVVTDAEIIEEKSEEPAAE